jgi:L-threonylcarbamoyladenylate synthase
MAAVRIEIAPGAKDTSVRVAPAAEALRKGELVIFPTETVYGLGAAADQKDAVVRIYAVKQRPTDKPFGYHIGTWAMFRRIAGTVSGPTAEILRRYWPGPLTFLLEVEGRKVGFRFPSDPVAQALLRTCGVPVVATSANVSGKPSPTSAAMAAELAYSAAYLIDAGPTEWGGDSTIVDLTEDPPRCLRRGVVPWDY